MSRESALRYGSVRRPAAPHGGQKSALTDFAHGHHGQLLGFALVFVGEAASAEEVVQDTWLAALDGLPAFAGRSALKTWIFRIVANRAKTRGAREARSIPFAAHRGPAVGGGL
ncbi:MAG: RNA polymerase sigma factor [Acidobacteria bacterium]|nr:RNA polymerase sigma factor [Acidobacteriota bacterium]